MVPVAPSTQIRCCGLEVDSACVVLALSGHVGLESHGSGGKPSPVDARSHAVGEPDRDGRRLDCLRVDDLQRGGLCLSRPYNRDERAVGLEALRPRWTYGIGCERLQKVARHKPGPEMPE